jgi:predicted nucleic acid-binding protein
MLEGGTIVVDANPIFAGLLGGSARNILLNTRFQFVTTEFTLEEVRQYLEIIAKKAHTSVMELEVTLASFLFTVFSRKEYYLHLREAHAYIGQIDPHDVDILALALYLHVPLWTNDKHFDAVRGKVHIVHTNEFIG